MAYFFIGILQILRSRKLILLSILTTSVSTAYSHSYLLYPLSDWHDENHPHCRRGGPELKPLDDCPGPCIATDTWFYNKDAPETVWRRGDRVLIKWTRNTHQNGFVRLALVPRQKRMSFVAHAFGTFQYSCWDINKRPCDPAKSHCGTDNYTYQTYATVPSVNNGEYVLGWSWYGGYGETSRGKFRYNFADYWSCANIKIDGGNKLTITDPPVFVPGNRRGLCRATTNIIGKCSIEPCIDLHVPLSPRLWRPYGFPQPSASPKARLNASTMQFTPTSTNLKSMETVSNADQSEITIPAPSITTSQHPKISVTPLKTSVTLSMPLHNNDFRTHLQTAGGTYDPSV